MAAKKSTKKKTTKKKAVKKKAAKKSTQKKTTKKKSATVKKRAVKKTTKKSTSKKTTKKKVVKKTTKKKTAKKPSKKKSSARKNNDFLRRMKVSLVKKKKELEPVEDLPFSYDETTLVLLVRDPYWAYSYWDFSGETWGWIQSLCSKDQGTRAVLRVFNLDDKSSFDIDIQLETRNWYMNVGTPDVAFEAELGLIDSKGRYHKIIRSNTIRTPRLDQALAGEYQADADKMNELNKLSRGSRLQGPGSEEMMFFKRISS